MNEPGSPPAIAVLDSGNRIKEQPISQSATLFVVAVVQFLTPFMFSAVGVALPAIGREFAASAVQLGLIEVAYLLGVATLLLPAGRYADINGRRRVFLIGVVVITFATVALAVSGSIVGFIAFRFLQGLGAAMISSTSLAILTSVFPAERRGRALGIVVGCVYLGLSAGPTLAGLMTSYLGWRWIFLVAVLVELTALALALVKLRGEWAEAAGEQFDWTGSLLYMSSLLVLILGVTRLREWTTGVWLAAAGIIGLLGFVRFELKSRAPLLDLKGIIRNRSFSFSLAATWINYAASFGVIFFFSIFLQVIKGLTPRDAGLVLVAQPLVQATLSPLAGRLADRYAPEKLATAGMALGAVALFVSAGISASSPLSLIGLVLVLLGSGFGLFSSPNTTAVMACVAPRQYGMAASLLATMRSTGMVSGMLVITVVLVIFLGKLPITVDTGPSFVAGMRTALLFFAVLSLVGIAFSMGRVPEFLKRNPDRS